VEKELSDELRTDLLLELCSQGLFDRGLQLMVKGLAEGVL
jgi:hypothetical protein